MLKLIEIQNGPSGYDPKSQTCKGSFSLKEIYINPDHIILMRENVSLKNKVKNGALVEGMDKSLSFAQLTISTPGHMSRTVNVVGSPESIFEDFKKSQT